MAKQSSKQMEFKATMATPVERKAAMQALQKLIAAASEAMIAVHSGDGNDLSWANLGVTNAFKDWSAGSMTGYAS